jgi:hypothetical protein
MNASQAGNSLFFGFHANKPVPSFLAEDCPLYDWCRPTDHPKFFAADAFAQKAGERILGDDAMAWCRKEFVNKLKNMVPKPKLINKAADLLDEEAACAIQKHWRNKKDSSSVFGEAESKLTREFGHPEDSLDILIKNTTVSNQKSLAELLLGTTDTEDLRRAEEQIGINNCDEELQFEDAVQMKEHYPNFSRQTSIASSLGQELKAGKENIIGKRNSEVCRSIYSFAGKGKDDQHSSSNMTGSCQKKQKPVNVIKFIPSANNRVSGAMKKSMSQTGIEITMAEQERNPLNDDLVFRAITIEHNRSHLDNSYHSEPSFLEETLIAALEQPLSRVAIEPYSMQKSVEFASFLKERSCPATPERSSLDSHLDLSSEEDKTAMFESVAVEPGEEERCGGYYSKEREPSATVEYHCQDFSIDLPPLETSLAVLSQHTASKPKPERIINKKGKNQEIEIFFSEEQEDPRMEVVTMVEPEFISPRQHFSNDLHAEKKTKAGQETCKSAHVPLLKHSGCKKSKKECLACKQASHADVSKSTKQADKRLGSFGKPSDRKQGLQSGQTSPSW